MSDLLRDFELTDEIKQLGVAKVLVTKDALYIYNGNSFIQSRYLKNQLQKTLTELKDKMIHDGCFGDENTVNRIIILLSKIWIKSAQDDQEEQDQLVKEHEVYKYSKDIPLAEQIILDNKSVFLQFIDDKPVVSPKLDLSKEQNIILYPHQHGIDGSVSPIEPLSFKNITEIEYIKEQAKKETIDSIYFKHKSLWQKLVIAKDEKTINFLAIDSVYSFFQDLFETTHYDSFNGLPGSGKGAVLVTFSLIGYRVVLAANFSGANLLDLYGSCEIGQIVLAEDELDNLHSDPIKHKMYKVGYDETGKTTKTLDGNTSNRNLRLYTVYGFKIGAAESKNDSKVLGGLNDRTFSFNSIKGKAKFYVKKLLKESKKPVDRQLPKYRKMIAMVDYTRKLSLIFRMLHHEDIIDEVETNIDGRALELTGPQIYLFSCEKLTSYTVNQEDTLLKNEILPALEKCLIERGELTKKTIDAIVYEALIALFKDAPAEKSIDIETVKERTIYKILYDDIYRKVSELTDGVPSTTSNDQAFYTVEYGMITHRQILKICRDRFIGKRCNIGSGENTKRAFVFDKDTIEKLGKTFEVISNIEIRKQDQSQDVYDNDKDEEIWKNWNRGYTGVEK
jgi:hypothetical protein